MAEGGKIKLPLAGEVKKSTALLGGGAIVVVVGYVYIKRRNAAASANTASSTGQVTDPAGNVCAALDPSSGYCPGSPEDEQFLQQQSAGLGGYGVGYGGYGGGYGGFVTDAYGNTCTALDPATGLCPVSGGTSGTPGQTSVTTNAQWVVEAENQLGNTSTVQAALGYALSGQPVTQDQKDIFMEAVGLLGPPPQGYPPLNVTGGGGGGGGGGPKPPPVVPPSPGAPKPQATVSVPNVVGQRATPALAAIRAAGFTAHTTPERNPLHEYVVSSQSPGGGSRANKGSSVNLNVRQIA